MKPKNRTIALNPLVSLIYVEEGQLKHWCSLPLPSEVFDVAWAVDLLAESHGEDFTGWCFFNHASRSGNFLGNDWSTASGILIARGLARPVS